jgi:hypothetical protein
MTAALVVVEHRHQCKALMAVQVWQAVRHFVVVLVVVLVWLGKTVKHKLAALVVMVWHQIFQVVQLHAVAVAVAVILQVRVVTLQAVQVVAVKVARQVWALARVQQTLVVAVAAAVHLAVLQAVQAL